MITKQQATDLLHEHTKNQNLRRHMYAVGFAMRALCQYLWDQGRLSEQEKFGHARTELAEVWEILGLLHDADWEETKDNPDEHTKHTLSWLTETDGPIVHALKSHNGKRTHLAELEGTMEWALETVDELTGFIVAVALVRPEPTPHEATAGQGKSKLQQVDVQSVLKKWKTKEFAKAVEREQIAQCEEKLGIPLPEFIQITLSAMQSHHEDLGL